MKKILAVIVILSAAASAQAAEFAVRLGHGGFRDERASDGKLGGGQLCLDITFGELPLSLLIGISINFAW